MIWASPQTRLLPDDSLQSITITGELSANNDIDYFTIYLAGWDALILDVDGASVGLDTVLTVQGPYGETAVGDDAPIDMGSSNHPGIAGGTLDSRIAFVAPTEGLYTFSIASFDQSSSGQYQLNVSIGDQAAADKIAFAADVAWLWSGERWYDDELTFGFPTVMSQYGTGSTTETSDNSRASTRSNVKRPRRCSVRFRR